MKYKENTASNSRLGVRQVIKNVFAVREITVLLLVVILSVAMACSTPQFLTMPNLRIILNYMATDMIMGSMLAIALIAGLKDFSIGSNMGFSAFVCGLMLNKGLPIWLCILAAMITGICIGALNATIVVRLKIIPYVATLGTWYAFKGAGQMIINSTSLSNFPLAFKSIVQDSDIFGFSIIVIVMLVVALFSNFLLKRTSYFHQAYFIGANQESAKLAGINVNKFYYVIYMMLGAACALAGVLSISRYGSAPASLGQGVEFRVVFGILIGGVSMSGGSGTILGAFLGLMLMSLIANALTLFNIDSNLQNVLIGIIMVFSVAIDEYNKRRKN